MSKKNRHTCFRQFTFKGLVLFMSMVYILGPLHKEGSSIWHNTSHFIEAVNSFLEDEELRHEELFVAHNHGKDNLHHNHDHHFIDFLNSLFENPNSEHNPNKSFKISFKVDKHFNTELLISLVEFQFSSPKVKWYYKKEMLKGYYRKNFIPPQNQNTARY